MKTYFKAVCALALMTFSSITGFAQETHSGCAHDTKELKEFLKEEPGQNRAFSNNEVANFPIKHWVITDANNEHSAPVDEFDEMMAHLNAAYLDAGIQFFSAGVEYYSNQEFSYMEFGGGEDSDLYNLIGDDNVLNCFWTTTNGWSWARFPSSNVNNVTNLVVMNSSHDKGVFVHEFGHTMGLLHTFQGGNELADGSNCTSSGDYVCDTPADPNKDVDGNCNYFGTDTDANGDLYAPMTENFMSYYGHCRAAFTQGQYDRARSFLSYEDRFSLISGISEAINLTATTNVEGGNITLSWQNTDVARGSIEIEKTVEGATEIITISDPEATSYIDADVSTTKWYSYKVRSNIFGRNGTWSNSEKVKFAAGGGCTGVTAWNASAAYNGGDQVTLNNIVYEAKWWTQGANPAQNSSAWAVWKVVGDCPTEPLDPWVTITNLQDGETVLTVNGYPQEIQVATNNDSIGIDSVKYIIVDVHGNYADVRRVTAYEAPFNITFNALTGTSYTEIYPLAFSNGVVSDNKEITVNFVEAALPEVNITKPSNNEDVWIHEFSGAIVVESEVNSDVANIDRVEYVAEYVYTNSAEVVRASVEEAPFTLNLEPKLCSRIEITCSAIDKFGRASQIDKRTVYPKDFTHNLTITAPQDGDNVTIGETVNVTIDVDNTDPILQVLWHVAYWKDGVRTIYDTNADLTAPYGFSFLPVEADKIDIVARTASYYGPGVEKQITVYPQGQHQDVLTIATPTDSEVIGTQKGFDLTLDFSQVAAQVVSVDWEFIGANYNEVRTITQDPFSLNWGFIEPGTYSAQAKATTIDGNIIPSQTIILIVVPSIPTATITAPASDLEFEEGETITFTVDAVDQDGSVEYVEWYVMKSGGLVPSTYIINQAPYTLNLNEDLGTYTVWAIAYDNDGRAGRSAENIKITIVEASQCAIQEWSSTAAYNGGDQVEFNGIVYEAKWWTQGANPEQNSSQWAVWKNLGPCGGTASPQARTFSVENGIFPNPATQSLNLNIGVNSEVKVFNTVGTLVYQTQVALAKTINVSSWKPGVYFIQYTSENGLETTSVVKK